MFKEKYLSLLHKQRDLLFEYENLFEEVELSEHPELINFLLLLDRRKRVYVENRCPLRESENDSTQLLTKPGDRSSGLRELRDFTRESESLIIIDPYFFSGESKKAQIIADDVEKCTRAKQKFLKRVHVVYDPSSKTNAVKTSIERMFKDNGIFFSTATTEEVHDRVWISDRNRALVVGTSLNGIGNRAAFLLPLPDSDLNELLDFLDEKSLSRKES
ncbi:hypothetical protein V3H24_14115 [Vibrio parahaemolyticus]|uniref:hypothetical protein n=2 Tax=Vibrio parahaemolyticus TaxID=670 RepID=UPI001DA12B01|nr:hypothetical protein [Vibrio vulnificus]EKB1982709.1 hypothetical protein [Vibrio parahaemolyticus]EHH0747029.1 hypothetical protein [Vibrio vulnificus]EME0849542.1 hypothetical protein [Vibrio parahaemolyticus]HAV1510907.1 hypothetical protein [Vibrio parahaemolyticus]